MDASKVFKKEGMWLVGFTLFVSMTSMELKF